MPIILHSEGEVIREKVFDYIRQRKKVKDYRVLDVGGSGNTWLGSLVTGIVDLNEPAIKVNEFYQGDICKEETWKLIPDKHYDFENCTHTLEDLRDPELVVKQLQRVARSGFISVPTKHTELSYIESSDYLGYCHHRWIFTIRQPYSSQQVFCCYFKTVMVNSAAKLNLLRVDSNRVGHDKELGFLWEDDFHFSYINGDFAKSGREMLETYAALFA